MDLDTSASTEEKVKVGTKMNPKEMVHRLAIMEQTGKMDTH